MTIQQQLREAIGHLESAVSGLDNRRDWKLIRDDLDRANNHIKVAEGRVVKPYLEQDVVPPPKEPDNG